MPHFTSEYSANLDRRLDIAAVCEVVRKAAVETGIFPLGGIRVRAIKCEHYAIADARQDYGFLDMVLRIGEGRDLPTRQKAGEHVFQARWFVPHEDVVQRATTGEERARLEELHEAGLTFGYDASRCVVVGGRSGAR